MNKLHALAYWLAALYTALFPAVFYLDYANHEETVSKISSSFWVAAALLLQVSSGMSAHECHINSLSWKTGEPKLLECTFWRQSFKRCVLLPSSGIRPRRHTSEGSALISSLLSVRMITALRHYMLIRTALFKRHTQGTIYKRRQMVRVSWFPLILSLLAGPKWFCSIGSPTLILYVAPNR